MGAHTDIEWADATFNPWVGCTKVSEACRNCYAERMAKRMRVEWGPQAARRPASERSWAQPIAWNRAAARRGRRRRVFCASMGDVFEDRWELDDLRARLWPLIISTTMLDWMLLTKHPENILQMLPEAWVEATRPAHNVWFGVTAETQADATRRINHLQQVPAVVRFASCEPLLERINLEPWLRDGALDWVIGGGESGPGARPCHPAWIRFLRDQCAIHGVPFLFKQWGQWGPAGLHARGARASLQPKRWLRTAHRSVALRDDGVHIKHDDLVDFIDGLPDDIELMLSLGKAAAGRRLDGRTWDEFPKQARLFW